MNKARIGTVALWIVTVLLAVAFVLAGVPKVLRMPVWVEMFDNWGYATWFLVAIGVLEILGGVLLLVPRVAFPGAVLLGVIMLGACYTHVANGEASEALRPLLYLVFVVIVGWARRPRRTAR